MLDNSRVSILCIEGKRKNNFAFAPDLKRKGYDVHVAESGAKGIALLSRLSPRVIIINAASLRTNSLRITSRFRSILPECPIFLIVDKGEAAVPAPEANVVLELPFTVQKLVNRVRTFQAVGQRHLISLGPLQLNTRSNMVSCNGREAHLTPRLTRILMYMMEEPNKVHRREELFQKVWETDYTGDTRTLDVHISWLRQALEDNPRQPEYILTVRSVGYQLRIPETSPDPEG